MNPLITRSSNLPVDPMFLARWSPRAFDGSPLPLTDLMTMFEAARWAPSANNKQPWRFMYALQGDQHWQTFVSLLHPANAGWAQHAGALVFLLADTDPPTHRFDAGAAWSRARRPGPKPCLRISKLGTYWAHLGSLFWILFGAHLGSTSPHSTHHNHNHVKSQKRVMSHISR